MHISLRVARTLATLLLPAALLVGVQAAVTPASAANPDNCRGQIMDLYKANGVVHARYRVWCAVTQDHIIVTPFLREGDRQKTPTKTCFNTYYCEHSTTLADRAGSQIYSLRAGMALYGAAGNTVAHNNGNDRYCDYHMPCAGLSKSF